MTTEKQAPEIQTAEAPKEQTGKQEGGVHCIWCGAAHAPAEAAEHLKTCSRRPPFKMTPTLRYMWENGKDYMVGEVSDRLLDIVWSYLKKQAFGLLLTVSIATSAVVAVTAGADYIEKTDLTAQEIREAQPAAEQEEPPAPPEEEETAPALEPLQFSGELMETLNRLVTDYMDAGDAALRGEAGDSRLDSLLLERAAGAVSDFTVTHDYMEYGRGWYDLNYDAVPAEVFLTVVSSPRFVNGDVNQGLDLQTELSAQLQAAGFHAAEYTLDFLIVEGEPLDLPPAEKEPLADRVLKYVIVMAEVDGEWYVASDYLVERRGVS